MLTLFNSVGDKLSQPFRRWLQYYLQRSVPRQNQICLTHKKLFIFPTKSGWLFLLAMVLIWLLGTNYENNLALAFSFLLLALFLVTIVHTFNNVYRLQLAYVGSQAVFVGEQSQVKISLDAGRSSRQAISLGWRDHTASVVGLERQQGQIISVPVTTSERGHYRPPRLLLQSTFPLGLWRCWSNIDLNVVILSYPKPIAVESAMHRVDQAGEGSRRAFQGDDNFDALYQYQAGDSLKHIAWKNYAQGRGLYSKKYVGYESDELWLEWQSLSQFDVEGRLSRLAYLALAAEQKQTPYGLRIPGGDLAPALGREHLQQVLSRLALFQPPEQT